MSRLMSGSLILTASRLSNFGLMLFSPLLLARILDVHGFGAYQEFMLYAMLLAALFGFGIESSVTYFLSKYDDRDRETVSRTSIIALVFSSVCLGILVLARPAFLKITSYDFVAPLTAYLFCFLNLSWIENYWVARRQINLVLYYSTARLVVRLLAIVVVAYVTRDVDKILWSAVAAEALRLLFVAGYMIRKRLFTRNLSLAAVREQLRFSSPIWVSNWMQYVDQSFGKLLISSLMGPAALAYYAVAGYLLPVIGVVRTSPSDVLFPELVRAGHDPRSTLRLWQRSTLLFCALFFPLYVVLTRYSELFIVTLFTAKFLPAVPLFQIYLVWVMRRCFSFDELLRSRGRTGFMMVGSLLGLTMNATLSLLLYHQLGIIGPAIAFVVSQVFAELYYARLAKKEFSVSVGGLLDWRGLAAVIASCLMAAPVLFAASLLPGPELVTAAAASLVFLASCWYLAFRLGVADIGRVADFALSRVRAVVRR